jgi:hypothetical protein
VIRILTCAVAAQWRCFSSPILYVINVVFLGRGNVEYSAFQSYCPRRSHQRKYYTAFLYSIVDATQNNILINENDNAFVADHGILSLCSELSGTSYITSNVRWAAPENFRISEDEEPRSSFQLACDVYSFGCIILQARGMVLAPKCDCNSLVRFSQEMSRTPNVEVTIKSSCRSSEAKNLRGQWLRTLGIFYGISYRSAGPMRSTGL